MGPRVDRKEVRCGSREGLGGTFVSSGGRIWVYIKLNRFMYTDSGPQRGSHKAVGEVVFSILCIRVRKPGLFL